MEKFALFFCGFWLDEIQLVWPAWRWHHHQSQHTGTDFFLAFFVLFAMSMYYLHYRVVITPTIIPTPTPTASPTIPALRVFFFASSLQLCKEACKLVKVCSSAFRILSDSVQSACKVASAACKSSIFFKSFSFSLVKVSSCAASSFDCLSDAAACCVSVSFKACKRSIARAASCKRSFVSSCRKSEGSAEGCRTEESKKNIAQARLLFHIRCPLWQPQGPSGLRWSCSRSG